MEYKHERDCILGMLASLPPKFGAMASKNWKRYAAVAALVEENFPARQDLKVLDFGCGYPFVVKLLLLRGYNVRGYDPYAKQEHLDVAGVLGVSGLDSPVGEYDLVLLVDVVEHLAVPAPTLAQVKSLLAPNGWLLVSTPNVLRFEMYWSFVLRRTGHPTALDTYLKSDNSYVHHQREFTMDELRRLLEHFGYAVRSGFFNDVRPDLEDLVAYQQASGTPGSGRGLKGHVFSVVRKLLPMSVRGDNMLVLAQRIR